MDNRRYTVSGGSMSEDDKNSFEKNGFLLVRKLIPQSDLSKYLARFQDICSGNVQIDGMTVMRDVAIARSEFLSGEKAITKIQDFIHDEVLFEFCRHKNILPYVRSVVGNDIKAMHTMLINKPPDPGTSTSRHPLHQDLHYFPFRPEDRIVCAWTAMEAVTRANGCLVVVPGSHVNPGKLLPHTYPDWKNGVNKMYHGISGDIDTYFNKRIHVPMDAGDTLFFHPLLIHGSGTNRTSGFRKAISCHYASTSECDYIDVRGTSQDALWQEIQGIARKRFGDDAVKEITFADIWRLRSRIVMGNDAKL